MTESAPPPPAPLRPRTPREPFQKAIHLEERSRSYVPPPLFQRPPATWRGFTVPFVAAWSSELVQVSLPEPALGGRPCLFPEIVSPRGVPILGRMECGRQRLAILEGLCQVCGKVLGGWKWSAAMGRLWTPETKRKLGDGWMRSEPPCCRRCAAIAARLCPALRRLQPGWQAMRRAQVLPQVMDGAALAKAAPAAYKGVHGPVIGYLEYMLTEARETLTWGEFLEATGAEVADVDFAAELEARRAAGPQLAAGWQAPEASSG